MEATCVVAVPGFILLRSAFTRYTATTATAFAEQLSQLFLALDTNPQAEQLKQLFDKTSSRPLANR